MRSRHSLLNDCICFVTAVTNNRMPIFGEAACAREAVETLYRVQSLHPFLLYGFVIMPDHCHILMRASHDVPLSLIVRSFKVNVTWNIGKGPIWQRGFDARESHDSIKILNYIHQNPVKKGLAEYSEKYPWSSASGKWDVSDLEIF